MAARTSMFGVLAVKALLKRALEQAVKDNGTGEAGIRFVDEHDNEIAQFDIYTVGEGRSIWLRPTKAQRSQSAKSLTRLRPQRLTKVRRSPVRVTIAVYLVT